MKLVHDSLSKNESKHDLKSLQKWAQDLIHHLCFQVQDLTFQAQELKAHVQVLTTRVKELEAQINTNSSNSGKPPSSDRLQKTSKNEEPKKKNRKEAWWAKRSFRKDTYTNQGPGSYYYSCPLFLQ